MSEPTAAPAAPATPAPATPAPAQYTSDTAGMSPSQVAALAFVDANRAEVMKGGNLLLQRKVNQALDHAFRAGSPNPDFLQQQEQTRVNEALHDQRPAGETDNLRAELEKPINIEFAVNQMAIKGLNREITRDISEIASACGLGEVQTQIALDRALRHLGPEHDMPAMDNYDYLDEPERLAEFRDAAAASFKGGVEELEQRSEKVRRWLATKTDTRSGKNMLALLDERGLTQSSLAFDPRLILQLCAAADRDGVA